MKELIKQILEKFGRHANARALRATYDGVALARFAKYARPEIPWTISAVAPRALAVLCNEVVIHKRRNLLECGCGISTLVLGELLDSLGGRVTTIDDDENWLSIVREMTSHLNNIDFIHAPLRQQTVDGASSEWYDRSIVESAIKGRKFDMVFVDGPKAKKKPFARQPSFAMIKEFLDEDFALFLDDADRIAERRIAQQWAENFRCSLNLTGYKADLAILRPSESPAVYCVT